MSSVWVGPSVLRGSIRAPPSKSYTHRAAIAAYLSDEPARVVRPLASEDTLATLAGLRRLGARVDATPGRWAISPAEPPNGRISIDAGSSGTTLRLLAPIAARLGRSVEFLGRRDLARRPVRPLLRALRAHGAHVRVPSTRAGLPVQIRGPISPGVYRIPGGSTSQFLSGLLLALPTLSAPSRIEVRGELTSSTYVEATTSVLSYQGVSVDRRGGTWSVFAPQKFSGKPFHVPGDASSAAYLWAGAAATGGRVSISGLEGRWPQADLEILPLLESTGARVDREARTIRVSGRAQEPFSADLRQAPDLVPLAAMLGALLPRGPSRIRFPPAIRRKESDRLHESILLVRALGGRSRSAAGALLIWPGRLPTRLRYAAPRDHRMIMASAVAALALPGRSRIPRSEGVSKSYPGFWSALAQLGAEVRG